MVTTYRFLHFPKEMSLVCCNLVIIAQLGLALSKKDLIWRNLPSEDFFQKDPVLVFYIADDSVTYFCKHFFFRSNTSSIINNFRCNEVELGLFCKVDFPVVVRRGL